MTTLAYLGPAGTFSEQAALVVQQRLNPTSQLVAYPTIVATVEAVAVGDVTWGIVPVENSLEGGVSATLDSCWQIPGIWIQQAQILPIRYALVSAAPTLATITHVYSHPQALGQCRSWLHQWLPQAVPMPTSSTTAALPQVSGDPTIAVICSPRAAELQNLRILAWVKDTATNQTRFWVLSRTQAPGGSLTSLAFSLPANEPGALLRPLQIFAERHLNLSRIESRPTKKSAGTYVFFVDVEHPEVDFLPSPLVTALENVSETLRIFGSYPQFAEARDPAQESMLS